MRESTAGGPVSANDSTLLHAVLDASSDHIYVVNREGRILYAGLAGAKILGLRPRDLVGKTFEEIGAPEELLERQALEREQAFKTGQPVSGTMQYPTVFGPREFEYSWWPVPVGTAGGPIDSLIFSARDVSERVRAEDELRRRERDLTDFVENATVGLHWVGPEGKILWANRAELEIVGYSWDEYIGHSIADFHADKDVIEDILDRLSCRETLREYPARLRRKDGSIRHVKISSNVYFENDQFVHTRCFTRDVTAEVETAKELEASEARYRRIVEMAQEGVWMVDSEYRTTFVNPRTAEMLGYSPEEMVGRFVQDFMDEDGRKVLEHEKQKRQAGQTGREDFKFFRRDGSLVWAIVSASPITDDRGQFAGAIALLTDVTERKQLEIAQSRLAAIVDTSEEAIVSKDLDGIVTSWNAAAERIYGWRAADIVGRSKALVIPSDLPDELPGILRRVRAGERIEHYETRRVRKDGTHFDAAISVSPVKDVEGRIVGAATIVHDITDRKRAERKIQLQQAELEALNDRLRRSMRETHHRVKNNLQIIAAMVDMQVLDRSVSGIVPVEEFSRLGGHIRTLAAVHDVLTHNVKEEEQNQLLSIRTVFAQLIPLLQLAAGSRAVRADIAEAQMTGKQCLSLALVTNELVSNAVKHGTGAIDVVIAASPETATLTVSNDGDGFPPDFNPEMSANTGLQLVGSLVETDLRGKLTFGNRPAGGAEVSVIVPLPGTAGTTQVEELH